MASFLRVSRPTQLASVLTRTSQRVATTSFSTFTTARAEAIDTTPSSPETPTNNATIQNQQPLSPFHTPLQAWVRDFKSNEPKDLIDLQRKVFGAPLRKDILHRVVVWQRDAERQGTQSTKGRSDVSGTTKKAFPQKGRGAARVGSLRAPQRRGGKFETIKTEPGSN